MRRLEEPLSVPLGALPQLVAQVREELLPLLQQILVSLRAQRQQRDEHVQRGRARRAACNTDDTNSEQK